MKVPFGKYKDKEITELLNDKNYFNWCIKEQIFNHYETKDPQFFEEINKHIIKPKKIKIVEEKKQCPNLGALIQNTETYVLAEKADKNAIYVCPDCGDKLFLKKGEIRVAHFSHYKKDNPCTYYTHPSESQIHKDAKLLLKYLLENKKVCIKQDCIKCKVIKNFNIEEKNNNVDIKLEYKFNLNDKIKFADVGYAMDGKLKYIFEIYNTHLTKENDRPEPWFEIEAKGLINNYKDENNDVKINCIRKKVCNECIEKKNNIIGKKIRNYFIELYSYYHYLLDSVDIELETLVRQILGQKWNNPQFDEYERVIHKRIDMSAANCDCITCKNCSGKKYWLKSCNDDIYKNNKEICGLFTKILNSYNIVIYVWKGQIICYLVSNENFYKYDYWNRKYWNEGTKWNNSGCLKLPYEYSYMANCEGTIEIIKHLIYKSFDLAFGF